MKIGFIVNEFPSVSQTFVLNQITGLLDRGHDVDIFAENPRSDCPLHDDVKKYNLLERTSYPAIPHKKLSRAIKGLSYVFKFITIHPLPIVKSLNVFKYGKKAASLTILFQIVPFLEKGAYDIIHCQLGIFGPQVLFINQIAKVFNKTVISFRGYDAFKYLEEFPGVYDELYKEGDLFLPVCHFLKDRIVRDGCDKNKAVVLRSGINCEKFTYSKRTRSEGEPTKVLTIGRLVEKKGIAYGLEAVARVVQSGRNISYSVIGDGQLRGELEYLIDDLGIRSNVRMQGWMPQAEVIRLLGNTHVLIAPSVTSAQGDQEGIPNVLKEAMALGIPVISTYHSGISELVEDGVSGYLVKERDVESLTCRLSYLIDHPELWSKMGQAGSSFVRKFYENNQLNDQLVELYRSLLDGTPVQEVKLS